MNLFFIDLNIEKGDGWAELDWKWKLTICDHLGHKWFPNRETPHVKRGLFKFCARCHKKEHSFKWYSNQYKKMGFRMVQTFSGFIPTINFVKELKK